MIQLQNESKKDDEKIEETLEVPITKEEKPELVHVNNNNNNKESPAVSHVAHFREKTPVKAIEIPVLKPVKHKKVISLSSILFNIHLLLVQNKKKQQVSQSLSLH